jgi:multimeric flavodoxin WrbA
MQSNNYLWGGFLKIVGVVCSPRLGGNTEILVKEALNSANEVGCPTHLITLSGKQIKPCEHCGACYASGNCSLEDDMQDIYPPLLSADGIIIGSPVYFWSVTGQAKLLMDRTYALRYPTYRLEGKVGGAIAVAGKRGQVQTLALINTFFLGQRMIPMHLGVDGRASKKSEILDDIPAMTAAGQLGKDMVKLITTLTT